MLPWWLGPKLAASVCSVWRTVADWWVQTHTPTSAVTRTTRCTTSTHSHALHQQTSVTSMKWRMHSKHHRGGNVLSMKNAFISYKFCTQYIYCNIHVCLANVLHTAIFPSKHHCVSWKNHPRYQESYDTYMGSFSYIQMYGPLMLLIIYDCLCTNPSCLHANFGQFFELWNLIAL